MPVALILAAGFAAALGAQSAPGDSSGFEVASIRPASADSNRPALRFTPGGGLRAIHVTLNLLVQAAYDVAPGQLSGGPRWADSDEYNVDAKGPEGGVPVGSGAEQRLARECLRNLLAERFRLAVRRESRDMPGYALVAAKNGPKLTASNRAASLRQAGVGVLAGEGVSMELLAKFLRAHVGRMVVDRTGLTDRYDFTLRWDPESEETSSMPHAANTPGLSLFNAVQEQLGLKLEARKVPTEVVTILRAEKPTGN